MSFKRTIIAGTFGLLFPAFTAGVLGQADTDRGNLAVSITDPSDAVIVGARVTLTGLDPVTRATVVQPLVSGAQGIVRFDSLASGRYRLQAEFAGFEGQQRDITVRRGDNRLTMELEVERLSEEVTVGDDAATAPVDPRGGFFLSQSQLESLPDDPVEMFDALAQMAGTDAIFVDGFAGGTLPAKSQIRSIHIAQDAFAAEYHVPGARVDIITKVGDGPLAGGMAYSKNTEDVSGNGRVRFQLRDAAASRPGQITPSASVSRRDAAANPLVRAVPRYTNSNLNADLAGTIVPKKSSFAVNFYRYREATMPLLYAALSSGNRAEVLTTPSIFDYDDFSAMFDHALRGEHAVRARYLLWKESDVYGPGGYTLPESSESWRDTSHYLRLQESGPLGSRAFINTRAEIAWIDQKQWSNLETTKVEVLDAFTGGGAQVAGGLRGLNYQVASSLDYVRGSHAIRAGFLLDADRNESTWSADYGGTYTFESLADYQAANPRSFRRTVGDPAIDYWFVQAGIFIQDDIRLGRNLVISPGVRYEVQKHLGDRANWAPRFGVNWSPGNPGQTAIRASWGIFYTWMNTGTYEQTLRFDGFHQDEIHIANPALDQQPTIGPSNRYRLSADLRMPRISRIVTSINQRVHRLARVTFSYTRNDFDQEFRGRNLNAPVNGIRPDPLLANVFELTSAGRSRQNQFNASLNVNLSGVPTPGQPAAAAAGATARTSPKTFDWRRLTINANAAFGRVAGDSIGGPAFGVFTVSPTGMLETEWSTADSSNAGFTVNNTMVRNLTVSIGAQWTSGVVYSQLSGYDTNGDLIFNDRPVGVGRNTLRGPAGVGTNAQVRYVVSGSTGESERPYRVELFVTASNMTNRRNFLAHSGVMTSPFFQAPVSVRPAVNFAPRTVTSGLNVSF